MWRWIAGVVLVAGCVAMPAEAQQAPKLTIERVFAGPDLDGTSPRLARLSPDGRLLTLLRNRPDDPARYDLWAMDTATGEWRMLVDSKKIGSGAELSEDEKMQRERKRIGGSKGIVAYDWSPDGKSILVPLDGDLYLATLDGKVTKLPADPGAKLNATISPRGNFASYVQDQNLIIMELHEGAIAFSTGDGKDRGGGTVHWGEAEFVAQEEMSRYAGSWWSPDDKRIAVERFDEAPVGVVTRAAILADSSSIVQQRYPKAGTDNVLVELWIMDPSGEHKVKVDLGTDPDIYLTRVRWAWGGKTLLVQRMSRDQKTLDVLSVDPATGASKILFTEKSQDKSWVNLSDIWQPMADGSLICWSERDGHGHLYRWKAGKFTQLTKGPWEVAEVVGTDEAHGKLYFLGNREDVLERQLYALDLKKGGITPLTERGWWNSATMDGAASRAIVTRSSPDQPPQVYLADTSGKRLAWVSENAVTDPPHPYHPYLAAHRKHQFGTFKAADGTDLHYELVLPEMEPGKKYPVFFQHYGGPHSQQVARKWGGALQQAIVDRGWIWFQIDNRGSANRGKAFEDAIYHAMGSVEVEDQLKGVDFLKTQGFVDPAKIVTYGWSYGGYMTLKMLEAAPGVFAAGVSGAPVTKWELYDTFYTERYMGDPRKVPGAYKTSNTLEDSEKIADPLLLLHGMADDNVVLEHSTAMMAKMQAAGQPFDVMLYPGQTHSAGRTMGKHVWRTIFDFLDRVTGAR